MQIHELGTRTPGVYDYAALDTGSQTYKAQVGDLKPEYTSYDAANPSSWVDVTTMGSNTKISTFFERLTYIVRNVRYLWKLIGSNAFSNVAETISGAIGNTALPTNATSLSGAIAEHEEDISQINGNLSNKITYEALYTSYRYKGTESNEWENTGASFTVPNGYVYVVTISQNYASGKPLGLALSDNATATNPIYAVQGDLVHVLTQVVTAGTYYICTKRATVPTGNNYYDVRAVKIKL